MLAWTTQFLCPSILLSFASSVHFHLCTFVATPFAGFLFLFPVLEASSLSPFPIAGSRFLMIRSIDSILSFLPHTCRGLYRLRQSRLVFESTK